MPQRETTYRGAHIRVEWEEPATARLYINNIERAIDTSDEVPCVLRLNSTVQTDYEWHEFVDVTLNCSGTCDDLLVCINQTELIREAVAK